MLNFLNPRYRHIRARHNLPYSLEKAQGDVPVASVVIPCTGADYIEEATLSASFAARFASDIREIVIVSDQPATTFGALPPKTRVVTLDVPPRQDNYRYKQIYRSRLIKIQAPLFAAYDGILMIDSDLNLLQMPEFSARENYLYASFRTGKMIAKLNGATDEIAPAWYRQTLRPRFNDHVNSAFLFATAKTWKRLCPLWQALFNDTWERLEDSQPPTDQLPLAALLDLLDLHTVNLGDWVNWPVSKKIGGESAPIPKQVIGAHGGFPLSEWQKYLADPDQPLQFKGQEYTRKVRYLTDGEKLESS